MPLNWGLISLVPPGCWPLGAPHRTHGYYRLSAVCTYLTGPVSHQYTHTHTLTQAHSHTHRSSLTYSTAVYLFWKGHPTLHLWVGLIVPNTVLWMRVQSSDLLWKELCPTKRQPPHKKKTTRYKIIGRNSK